MTQDRGFGTTDLHRDNRTLKVFVIPSWHPTPSRPFWCNWILPHIELLRESGMEAYVLQLGLDDEPPTEGVDKWKQPIRLLSDQHLYVPVPRPTRRFERTRFTYGSWLRKYCERLRDLYDVAVEKWGRPDILHAHVSLPAGYAAANLGECERIPVIVQEHYTGFESDARFFWRVGRFIKHMDRRIHGFYAVSPGYARRIQNTRLVNVTGVLPNPVDTDLFRPLKRTRDHTRYEIVTAGGLNALKGTDLLLEAVRKLPSRLEWHLTIFGDSSKRDQFDRWLSDPALASRITLRGTVSQAELANAYSSSDLYVVASRNETANVSMLQAMACGVPVLTTSCGAPETLIDESVGIAVAPNDAQAITEGIRQVNVLSTSCDRSAVRQFVVDRYAIPVVARLVTAAYQDAREKQKAGRTYVSYPPDRKLSRAPRASRTLWSPSNEPLVSESKGST